MRLLFVCTGNICRSPVAERLTLGRASRAPAGSPELTRVEVRSAGVHATPGSRLDALFTSVRERLAAPVPA